MDIDNLIVGTAISLGLGITIVLICLALRLIGLTFHSYSKEDLTTLTTHVATLHHGLTMMNETVNSIYTTVVQEKGNTTGEYEGGRG